MLSHEAATKKSPRCIKLRETYSTYIHTTCIISSRVKGAKKFLKALTKHAGKHGASGIKKLSGKGIKGFMYEVKIIGKMVHTDYWEIKMN